MTDLQRLPPVLKTHPKSALNWAHQTLGLFPPTQKITDEFLATLVSLFCDYPETVLAKALDPKTIIAKHQYLPDLKSFKDMLDEVVSAPLKEAAEARQLREQFEERKKFALPKRREEYLGPIEEIKPGDILPFSRIPEYEQFMKVKHNLKVRHWTATEEWQDNGQRPFAVKIKQEENPFE